MFEQRINSQTADQYYFQLAPNYLNIKNSSLIRSLKTSNKVFRLKLVKGPKLSDQSKKPTSGKPVNGKIPFEKTQLNFYLPSYNPNRNIQYKIILLQGEESSEKQQEIGNYTLMSGDYISQFIQHKVRLFSETINISQDYSLSLDIFLNNTRYGLQKFIRETREQRKQDTRNNVVNKQQKHETPKINRTKSINSESSQGQIISGENRFMSPSRRIVRKSTNQKKLLMRNGSPQSQRSGGSRASSRDRNIKFISGRDEKTQPKRERTTLAQQQIVQVDKRKQEEQKKRKILEEDARATREVQRKREEETKKRQQQKKIEEDRRKKQIFSQRIEQQKNRNNVNRQHNRKEQLQVNRQSRRVQRQVKQQNNKGNIKNKIQQKIQVINPIFKKTKENAIDILQSSKAATSNKLDWEKPIGIKRTESRIEDEKHIMHGSGLHFKKPPQTDLKTIAMYTVFIIISVLLVINAMTPSSKV